MGEAGNVFIKDPDCDGGVCLYTQVYAMELPAIVQRALGFHEGWDDDSHLARVIYSEMLGHYSSIEGKWPSFKEMRAVLHRDSRLLSDLIWAGGTILTSDGSMFGNPLVVVDTKSLSVGLKLIEKVGRRSVLIPFERYVKIPVDQLIEALHGPQ